MNNNKKLSKKVKHVLPLALAAALTVTGTGITASAQTFNHSFVRQISVVANTVTPTVILDSTNKVVVLKNDGYYVGAAKDTANKVAEIPGEGLVVSTNDQAVEGAEIIVDGVAAAKVTLVKYKATGAKLVQTNANETIELTLAGDNSITGIFGGSSNGNAITVKGKGTLDIGGAVTGALTVNGDVAVKYVSAGSVTNIKGVVYVGNVGTVYGDPDVTRPDSMKNLKLGVKIDTSAPINDIVKSEEVEYTGKDAVITPIVQVKRKVLGEQAITLTKDTDYTVDFDNVIDKVKAGMKNLSFTAKPGTGYDFTAVQGIQLKVNKKNIKDAVVELTEPAAKDYTGETQNVVVKGVKVGDLVVPASDYTLSDNQKKDAGKYKVKLDASASDNFTGTAEKEWEIKKVSLTPSAVIKAKEFDGTDTVSSANVTVQFEGLKGSDNPAVNTDYKVTAKYDRTSIGDRNVDVTVEPVAEGVLKNYTLTRKNFRVGGKITKKATPTAPNDLTGIQSVSRYNSDTFSYTLSHTKKSGEKYEYKMDNGSWQSSNMFNGIAVGAAHDFYVRVAKTELNDESPSSTVHHKQFDKISNNSKPVLTYTVSTNPGKPPVKKTVTIVEQPGAEYSFGSPDKFIDNNKKIDAEVSGNLVVKIRFKATKTQNASESVENTINLSLDTLNVVAPSVDGEQVKHNTESKFSYNVKTAPAPAGFEYEYNVDGGNSWASSPAFIGPYDLGSTHVFYVRLKETATGRVSVAGNKTVKFDLIKRKAPTLKYTITGNPNKKTIAITTPSVDAADIADLEYKFGSNDWGTSQSISNISDATYKIGVRLKENKWFAAAEKYATVTVNGTKGVVNNGDKVVKPDEPKKDDPKKDNTKKPDETKKPDDTKKPDNNTTKPANVDKAIKDAFKKSTKSGSVSLTGIGSALKKAVGENAASLSVNLKTSKTKATAASVTKKLKGSKLVKNTVYSLNVKSGATNLTDKQVSGSKIKVTLKVSLGNKNRTVYVMDVSTGKRVKAKYNAKTKKITFTTANVGDFVIVNKAK